MIERRRLTPYWASIISALAALAAITFLTVCPVQLRPTSGEAHLDRLVAYAVLGSLIALALRRRPAAAIFLALGLAVGLEALQLVIPGRDARIEDAIVKALGASVGVGSTYSSFPIIRWIKSGKYTASRARAL
jgi:VanZ family protein